MKKYKKLIRILNKLKKNSKATDETIAALTDGELTSDQVSLMLTGTDDSYLTPKNIDALQKGVLAAHEIFFNKLVKKIKKRIHQILDEDSASDS